MHGEPLCGGSQHAAFVASRATAFALQALLSLVLLKPPAAAEIWWTHLGPFGGQLEGIVSDETVPGLLYGTRGRQVVRSEDGGQLWHPMPHRYGFPYRPRPRVVVDPRHGLLVVFIGDYPFYWDEGSGTLVLATHRWQRFSILCPPNAVFSFPSEDPELVACGNEWLRYLSRDRGVTWKRVDELPSRFEVEPVHRLQDSQLEVSVDLGRTWRLLSLPTGSERPKAVHSGRDGRLVVGFDDGALYRSDDNASQWVRLPLQSDGLSILSVSGSTSLDRLVALLEGGGIHSSLDGGQTWSLVRPQNVGVDAGSLYLSPSTGDLLTSTHRLDVGGAWSPLEGGPSLLRRTSDPLIVFRESSTSLSFSRDGGITWAPITPPPGCYECRPVVDPADGTLLARTRIGSEVDNRTIVLRSSDGQDWAEAGPTAFLRRRSVADFFAARDVWLWTEIGGVGFVFLAQFYASKGGFATVSAGPFLEMAPRGLVLHPLNPRLGYFYGSATYSGPYGTAPASEFSLIDLRWPPRAIISRSVGSYAFESLAIDPRVGGALYVLSETGALLESTDGGFSVEVLATPWADVAGRDLIFDSSQNRLLVSTENGVFAGAVEPEPTCGSPDCLSGGRYRVEVEYQSCERCKFVPATAFHLTDDTVAFWFFNVDNIELVLKVLDGCWLNDHRWIFAAGLTNVGLRIFVQDRFTSLHWFHEVAFGETFRPVQDTSGLACSAP